MDQELFVKIFIIFYIIFYGLVDLLSSFNFRWSDSYKINKYFGQFAGMYKIIKNESNWQQGIQVLSAFIIMPCLILVFFYTMNPDLSEYAIPFGTIAASILLGCKSLQICELVNYKTREVLTGYLSIFALSFFSLFIINYLSKGNLSIALSIGVFISTILFPMTIIKITNNRKYH